MADYLVTKDDIARVKRAFPHLSEIQVQDDKWVGSLGNRLQLHLIRDWRRVQIIIPALRIKVRSETLGKAIAGIQEEVADQLRLLSLCLPPEPKTGEPLAEWNRPDPPREGLELWAIGDAEGWCLQWYDPNSGEGIDIDWPFGNMSQQDLEALGIRVEYA